MKYFLVIILVVCWGCTTDLNVELPYEGKRLVLWCILSPDRPISARLDQTYPPTGKYLYEKTITNATIEVLENEKVVETLKHSADGVYTSPNQYRPIAGRSYKVRAKAAGFPDIEGNPEVIPSLPQITNSSFSKKENNRISVEIQDIKNEINQYSIQIVGTYKGYGVAINTTNLSRPDAISDNCGFRGNWNTFFYRDVCFDGNKLNTSYAADLFGTVQAFDKTGFSMFGNKEPEEIQIIVKNCSAAYFDYYKTYPPEGIDLAFKQPISRLYNLKGGYGLVASYNQRTLYYLNR